MMKWLAIIVVLAGLGLATGALPARAADRGSRR